MPGIADGEIIKMVGGGEAGERGAQEGDLFLHVRVRPHATFARQDDHLIVEKEIALINLLAYFSDRDVHPIAITTIAGRKLTIDIPSDFAFNKPLKVGGEGMPHFNRAGKGDLFVHFKIAQPHKMNKDAKRLLEDLRKEMR